METKTHWKKLQHPDYIGAYELMDGTDNKELVVQIKKVSREMITGADGKKEECTVCHLNSHKPMILNATNQKTMTKLFGSPYIEDWAGKKMTLYVARIKAFGETVDALRVRPTAPSGTKGAELPELTPNSDKWGDARKAILGKNTTVEAIRKKYVLSAENEALLTKPNEPTVTIDSLRDLLDEKRDKLSVTDLKEANRIINSADESSYPTLNEVLTAA